MGNVSANRKIKILVVDDEPDVVAVIKMGLEKHGFEVDAFTDPSAAKSQFKQGIYDLLLIDIRMPRISGFDLYRELVKIDDKAKICFITAFEIYYDEFRRVFPKLKVDCFVKKPVSMEVLAELINRELKVKEQIRSST
jgi:DNA-binding response OmpR family regulator